MNKFLLRIIILIIILSFSFYVYNPPVLISSDKVCSGPASLKREIYRSPVLPTIGLVWVDLNCDNVCDEVVVMEYLGKDSDGKPIFMPVGVLTCEEANQFHKGAENNTMRKAI
jgi:hypothetical protein